MDPSTECKLFHCSFEGCEATFARPYKLNRHIRGHKGERPYLCDIEGCDKSFTCKFYLAKHKKRPHNEDSEMETGNVVKRREKRYNCETCLKEFRTKFLLKTHSAEHTGEKPFKCDQCEAAFALRSRLKRHLAHHRGYPCDQPDCGVVLENRNQLRKHVATAHKITNECSICGKTFFKKSNLKAHLKAHKFNCEVEGCIRSFVRKCQLKEHVDLDHCESQEIFNCDHPDCNAKFTDSLTLTQHLTTHSVRQSNSEIQNSVPKKIIFPYRKSLAQELSGFEASKDELTKIFHHDKNFRKEIDGLV